MASLFSIVARENGKISTSRLHIIPPASVHYEAWVHLRTQSRRFLEPFEPNWPEDELSKASFKRRLKRYNPYNNHSNGFGYFLFLKETGALVGGITISRLLRGIAQSCTLGYWIGYPFAKQGYMTEAVLGILPEIFEQRHFHRLEAACLPHNIASIKVLEKSGFQREGYARQYLKINGHWQDHLLFAMLESDYEYWKGRHC